MLSLEYRLGLGAWFIKGKVAPEGLVRRTCEKVGGASHHYGSPSLNVPNNLDNDTTNCSAARVGHTVCFSEGFQPVMIPPCTGDP